MKKNKKWLSYLLGIVGAGLLGYTMQVLTGIPVVFPLCFGAIHGYIWGTIHEWKL